jgi:hypothetical protein
VYDRRRIERDFPSFRVTRIYKRFMHAPPLPVHRLPGETLMGWHLWAHLEALNSQHEDASIASKVGWSGRPSPPGSDRSGPDSRPSSGSCYPDHQE